MSPSDDNDRVERARRREILATTGAVAGTLLAGCRGTPEADGMSRTNGDGSNSEWLSVELSTVRSEETFTVGELDPPVVIQTFATWSADSQQQSSALAELTTSRTVVSLDTAPEEDAATVAQYATDNGFDWRFAVASTELTNALISEFGPSVAKPRQTPIIVVCEGGSTMFRAESVLSTTDIERIVSDC